MIICLSVGHTKRTIERKFDVDRGTGENVCAAFSSHILNLCLPFLTLKHSFPHPGKKIMSEIPFTEIVRQLPR